MNDDEWKSGSLTDRERDFLIQENQAFLVRVQGLMLEKLNSDLESPSPTNWLGKWAKSKSEETPK